MVYDDPEINRAYQREWANRRLSHWLLANGPCKKCGSPDNLKRVRNTYAAKRFHGTSAFSALSKDRYTVLCASCARQKIGKSFRRRYTGTGRVGQAVKLDEQKVRDIVEMVRGGISMRRVGRMMGVNHSTVSNIMSGKIWSHVLKPSGVQNRKGVRKANARKRFKPKSCEPHDEEE